MSETMRQRFRDEAMATHFEILFDHPDRERCGSLAALAFREVERLESLLSRFMQGSDIYRINNLQKGESIGISNECHECLLMAMELGVLTNGLFDIGAGCFMPLVRDDEGRSIQSGEEEWTFARRRREEGRFIIHEDRPEVSCETEGLVLDLGGIGKGFALEVIDRLLSDFDDLNYLLSAGGSTLLARGFSSSWKVNLSGESEGFSIDLKNESLSSSSFETQGAHIIRLGHPSRESHRKRVWVEGPNAALCDGLSTAFLLMDRREIKEVISDLSFEISVWEEGVEGDINLLTVLRA